MSLPRFLCISALAANLVCPTLLLFAQTTTGPASDSRVQTSYPEDGYLAHDRYTNAFFGFWLEFPAQSYLKPIPMPLPPKNRDDLLEVLGPAPTHAQISIVAFPPDPQRPRDAKAALRALLDQELSVGVEELHGLSKTSISGRPFYMFETRHGADQHGVYATEMNGYIVRFIVSARDPKVVQQLEKSLSNLKFVDPKDTQRYAGLGAVRYQGPSIPHRVLETLVADPPGQKIEAGTVQGNTYENRQLGLSYLLPKDWKIGHEGAVQPAVERWRLRNAPESKLGETERTLRQSCERVLFSAWKTQPAPGEDVLYDDFGEVTVSAMSLSCFPSMRFPSDLQEQNPIRDFLLSYALTHPIMRDMKGARAFETGGKLFVVSQGVVAYQSEGEALSRRVSIAMALTQHRGYLISFFFAAPHDSDLRELMNAKASFAPDETGRETAAGQNQRPAANGSDVVPTSIETAEGLQQTPAPAPGTSAPQMNSSTPEPQPPATTAQAPNSTAAAEQATPRPTLLNPGETMQDQQMKGTPLPGRSTSR